MEKSPESHLVDPEELELPETVFSRDISNKVFQDIVAKTISRFPEVSLKEETFFDQVIPLTEKHRGIIATQDPATKSIKVSIELSVAYGTNIPQKAEEIQSAVVEDLSRMTGLHVAEVHIVFKNIIRDTQLSTPDQPNIMGKTVQEEFEHEF